MKKLCAFMLVLLLIVPSLAMAEKVPYETLKVDEITNWDNVYFSVSSDCLEYRTKNAEGVTDKFQYYYSGTMKMYRRDLGQGRSVAYSPSGELSENHGVDDLSKVPPYDPVKQSAHTATAPSTLEELVKGKGMSSLEAFYAGAVPASSISISGNDIMVNENIDLLAAGKYNCQKIDPVNGVYTYNGRDELTSIVVKKGDLMSVFGIANGQAVLLKVCMDSVSHYVGDNTHMYGDKNYIDAVYGNDGNLEHFFLYSSDMKIKTAYDRKNRLTSHETWTDDGAYWCCWYNEDEGAYIWETSADGDPFNTKRVTAAELPEEVLKGRLISNFVAEYDVGAPIGNVNELEDENEGLPFIVAADANLKNAKIKVESEQNNATTSTFNVTPENGGKAVQPAGSVTLYLPLPAGMNKEIAQNYDITVKHEGEVFSTIDQSAEVTKHGLKLNVTHFSPYTVIWGDEAEDAYNAGAGKTAQKLPATGDNSRLLVYLAVLVVSGVLLAGLKKRTA